MSKSRDRQVDFLLEGKISRSIYEEIAAAATAKWGTGSVPGPSDGVDDVVWRRHDNTVRFIVPWIERIRPLSGQRVIDFGCGCGSSSLAMSHFADEVVGLEIDPPSVEAFRTRMDAFGARNSRVIEATPEEILGKCLDLVDEKSVVLLVAVVEHLTPNEQLLYLSEIWRALAPGQLLVIAETPNFLGLMDSHTFGLPFAHMTQGPQFESWLRAAPSDLRFRDHLLGIADTDGTDALLTERFRLGIGVPPQVFELALDEDLNEIVVADGFSNPIIDWFPLTSDDRHLLEGFRELQLELPIGFARSVLSFVFRKPANGEEASDTREWNLKRRRSIQDLADSSFSDGAGRATSTDVTQMLLLERERELESLYSSRSWRWTKPFRTLAGFRRRR